MISDASDEGRHAEIVLLENSFAEELVVRDLAPALAVVRTDIRKVSRIHTENPVGFFEEIKHKFICNLQLSMIAAR